jgi:hypothetical protein
MGSKLRHPHNSSLQPSGRARSQDSSSNPGRHRSNRDRRRIPRLSRNSPESRDTASNTTYDIDAQNQVKQFEGKKVRVHGTLDPNGKVIHVQ